MTKKKVLIIENKKADQLSLQIPLEKRGVEVFIAGNVSDARRLAELHWDELDVVIYDMLLDDPNEPDTKGADIGIEFRKKKKSFSPESLIYSNKNEIDFYQLAWRLGAAAYLLKEVDRSFVVVQHTMALALRRALNGENPKVATEVARIAVHSKSPSEAIQTFCKRVLKPELDSCLGAPFIVLLTEDNKILYRADNAGLPEGAALFYHRLQVLAHGRENLAGPFILETNKLESPPDQETALLHERLNLAAFLPLSLSGNLRLSIGILHQEESEQVPVPTDEKALCNLLEQYLRPTVLENITTIWSQWTELRATRTSTAKLCLSVGQEIKDSLATAELERLEDLADDLNDTGQLLIQLDSRNGQGESDDISVKRIIATAWEWIVSSEGEVKTKLELQGDCTLKAQRSDLEIIFSRLLLWLLDRSRATPLDIEPTIKIKCESGDGVARILFEDNSHRLHPKLRKDMFAPFTQAIPTPFAEIKSAKHEVTDADAETPAKSHLNTGRYLPLYLAKMLVEGHYQGLLEDHSDEIKERSYGHQIIVQFSGAGRQD